MSELSAGMAYILFLSIGFFAGVSPMGYTMTTRFCEKAMAGTAFGLLTCAPMTNDTQVRRPNAVPAKARGKLQRPAQRVGAGLSRGVAAGFIPGSD